MGWSKNQECYLARSAGKKPLSEISKYLNKTESCVKKKASRMNVSLSYFGSGCHRVNYDYKQIDEAKELLATGLYTNRKIAEVTGLSENYISQLKNKQRRAFIPAVHAAQALNQVFC